MIFKCIYIYNIHMSLCMNQSTLTYIITPIYFVIITYILTYRITGILHIPFIDTCIIRYIHMSLCTYSHADYIYIYRYHCIFILYIIAHEYIDTCKWSNIPMPLFSFCLHPPSNLTGNFSGIFWWKMAGGVSWNWDILRRSYRGAKSCGKMQHF